jgi:hypothetical protein
VSGVRWPILALLVSVVWAPGDTTEQASGTEPPVTTRVVAMNSGDWAGPGMWFITIDETGKVGAPRIEGRAGATSISTAELRELKEVIQRERFFDLDPAYGPDCIDCPACLLSITVGNRQKRVSLSTAGFTALTSSRREEMARALRVWDKVKELAGVSGLKDACH